MELWKKSSSTSLVHDQKLRNGFGLAEENNSNRRRMTGVPYVRTRLASGQMGLKIDSVAATYIHHQ